MDHLIELETPDEAFDYALRVIEEIRATGIEVGVKLAESRNNLSMVEKFDQPDRVSPSRWSIVTFKTPDESSAELVRAKADYLGGMGMAFDTSGIAGERSWEMDWSFRFTGEPDTEWAARRGVVETLVPDC